MRSWWKTLVPYISNSGSEMKLPICGAFGFII
jgi:hypothetical protein